MLTSKQRSYLRKLSQDMPDIILIGKEGMTEDIIDQTRKAIVARELIKGKVQQNSVEDVKEVAKILADETKSEIVFVIGKKFLLYKKNLKKPKIEMPSKKKKKK